MPKLDSVPGVKAVVLIDALGAGGALTVIANVRVAFGSVALIAVIVYVLETAAVVGVPEIRPVEVLKDSPGVLVIAGEIAKLAIVPPAGVIEYPVIAVPTVTVSDDEEIVNAGAATPVAGNTAVIVPEFAE